LKYGCNNKFTEVQHLDIFEVLVEVATEVETTTKQRVIMSQWDSGSLDIATKLGKRRLSIIADKFGHTQLWVEGSVDGCTGCG
jgi:hypothetical protein